MRCGTRTFRLCGGRSFLFACLAFLLVAGNVWARPTPYDKKPAAIVTEDYGGKGLLWDFQLAEYLSSHPGRRGLTAAVFDFCHSGGFVDDLSPLSNFYVATACDWDEFSYGVFGQTFMSASKTGPLHQAFEEARPRVSHKQTPQEWQDGMGNLSLFYLPGDRAVLFSAMDREKPTVNEDFWRDITTARDALMKRSAGKWPKDSIAAYYGDGTRTFQDGTKVNGAATKTSLFSAIGSVYADQTFTENSLLFLYLNNHGTSTDVLKSRYRGGVYEYEITTSLYANLPDLRGKYGIAEVWIQVPDKQKAHYKNPKPPKDSWDFIIELDDKKNTLWMKWYSTRPKDPSTWLESGRNYSFSYEYPVKPEKVQWGSWAYRHQDGLLHLNDCGKPDGSAWGVGWKVYGADHFCALDPEQWPGWDNGGDGWVLAPAWAIPEPVTLLLFGYGLIPLVPVFWRRVQK